MEKIIKTLRYNKLLNLYKSLLTHTQQEVMEDYFVYDLSLSEIAEERNISRAAVEDAIKKSVAKLDEYENNLKLLDKNEEMLKFIEKLKQKALNSSEIEELEELERNLK